MANQEYLEKLKDPRWQKRRLEILQRDNWYCQRCYNDSQTLNITLNAGSYNNATA
jgi:hypothetical protein